MTTAREAIAEWMRAPQCRVDRRLGIPRETQAGGELTERLVTLYLSRDQPGRLRFLGLTEEYMRGLERELGRTVLNSGDVLFGNVMVTRWDEGEDATAVDDVREQLR